MAHLIIEATDANLDAVHDFIHTQLEPFDCSPRFLLQLDLAVEEIFVNIAHYAYEPNAGTAEIICAIEKNDQAVPRLTMIFKDSGKAFNPLARPDPDPNTPLEERGIGGWGIYLTKKYMDSVVYEYADGKNVLTLEKALSEI